jgi:hypothetical protein
MFLFFLSLRALSFVPILSYNGVCDVMSISGEKTVTNSFQFHCVVGVITSGAAVSWRVRKHSVTHVLGLSSTWKFSTSVSRVRNVYLLTSPFLPLSLLFYNLFCFHLLRYVNRGLVVNFSLVVFTWLLSPSPPKT